MSYEEDPEVIADLRLRAATERDPTRTRGAGVYNWKPPEMVGMWRCRRPGCKTMVPVDAEALEHRAMFNAELKRRMEAPLDQNDIALCDKCRALFNQERSYRLWERKERMKVTIRELKEHANPRKATELLAQLAKDKHPDIPGLLDAIEQRRASKGEKRTKAGGL